MGCLCLFQGIFLTQVWNPGPLHCKQNLYHLNHLVVNLMQKKPKSCHSPVGRQQEAQLGSAPAAGGCGSEVASTHHVLLRGVLVALEDSDPVPAAHVLDLSHRLAPEFLQGREGALAHRTLPASRQQTSSSPQQLPGSSPPERPGGGAQVPRRSPGSGLRCRSRDTAPGRQRRRRGGCQSGVPGCPRS